jgi:hypothetical protein
LFTPSIAIYALFPPASFTFFSFIFSFYEFCLSPPPPQLIFQTQYLLFPSYNRTRLQFDFSAFLRLTSVEHSRCFQSVTQSHKMPVNSGPIRRVDKARRLKRGELYFRQACSAVTVLARFLRDTLISRSRRVTQMNTTLGSQPTELRFPLWRVRR